MFLPQIFHRPCSRIVILVVLASLVSPGWAFPRTTATVLRLPRGTLGVRGATHTCSIRTFVHFRADWTVGEGLQSMGSCCSSDDSCCTYCAEMFSPRTTVTVFRLPRCALLVIRATLLVQLTQAPSVHACTFGWSGRRAIVFSGDGFSDVLAAYGLVLSFWWSCFTCCAELDFLRNSQASTWHTARDASKRVLLTPAPSVLACTSVRTGLRTFPLSLWTAVPAAAMVSPTWQRVLQGPVPTNCSGNYS